MLILGKHNVLPILFYFFTYSIMKKLVLFLSLLGLLFPFSINATDDNIGKVLRIESYYHLDDHSYTIAKIGSAVYTKDKLIYTTASTILDYYWKPTLNYKLCETTDFKKEPECFSDGRLLYYDEKSNLAILDIVDLVQKEKDF